MTKNHKAKMAPHADSAPGLETDGQGHVIPLAHRTREDQVKASGGSVKNPEREAENPAPMPHDQQGQGGKAPHHDPEGRQGSTKH